MGGDKVTIITTKLCDDPLVLAARGGEPFFLTVVRQADTACTGGGLHQLVPGMKVDGGGGSSGSHHHHLPALSQTTIRPLATSTSNKNNKVISMLKMLFTV